MFQSCQQRSARKRIREIEPGDAEDADPRSIASVGLDPAKCRVEVGRGSTTMQA